MHAYLHSLDNLLHVSTCAYVCVGVYVCISDQEKVSQVCSCSYLCVTAYVGYARQARYVFLCTGEKPPNCVHVCLCVCQATRERLCPVESFRSMSMCIEVAIHLQRSERMLARVVAYCLQYMNTWKTRLTLEGHFLGYYLKFLSVRQCFVQVLWLEMVGESHS